MRFSLKVLLLLRLGVVAWVNRRNVLSSESSVSDKSARIFTTHNTKPVTSL